MHVSTVICFELHENFRFNLSFIRFDKIEGIFNFYLLVYLLIYSIVYQKLGYFFNY